MSLEKKVKENDTPRFDPDLSPDNSYNKKVAHELGFRYDPKRKVYRDSDGCPVRDRFGQYLG